MYRRELCAVGGIAFVSGCLRLVGNRDSGEPDGTEPLDDDEVRDETESTESSDESEIENEPNGFPSEPAFRLEEAWTGPDRGKSVQIVGDRTLIAGKNTNRTTEAGNRITVGGVASISSDGDVQWRRYKDRTFGEAPLRRVEGEIYAGESRLESDAESAIVVALTDDGTERWRFETEDSVETLSPVLSSTIIAGTVRREDDSGTVYALDRETGDVRWEEQINGEYPTCLGASSGIVYFKLWNELRAYDVETGDEQWRIDARNRFFNDIRVIEETVYTSYNNEIRAHATTDGEVVWKGEMFNPLSAPPVLTDEMVLAGSNDTGVYAFDVETGERRWRHQAESAPVDLSVGNDRIWVTTDQDSVFALSMDGEPLFRTDIDGDISINTHATAGDRLVVTGVRGTIGYLIKEA
jgi:outer membrane protein assembly factor BamB